MYKVFNGLAPEIMKNIFPRNHSASTEDISANSRSKPTFYNRFNPKTTRYGLETLRSFGPKVWDMVPSDINHSVSISLFKEKIKSWIPSECPCKLCKRFIPGVGYT